MWRGAADEGLETVVEVSEESDGGEESGGEEWPMGVENDVWKAGGEREQTKISIKTRATVGGVFAACAGGAWILARSWKLVLLFMTYGVALASGGLEEVVGVGEQVVDSLLDPTGWMVYGVDAAPVGGHARHDGVAERWETWEEEWARTAEEWEERGECPVWGGGVTCDATAGTSAARHSGPADLGGFGELPGWRHARKTVAAGVGDTAGYGSTGDRVHADRGHLGGCPRAPPATATDDECAVSWRECRTGHPWRRKDTAGGRVKTRRASLADRGFLGGESRGGRANPWGRRDAQAHGTEARATGRCRDGGERYVGQSAGDCAGRGRQEVEVGYIEGECGPFAGAPLWWQGGNGEWEREWALPDTGASVGLVGRRTVADMGWTTGPPGVAGITGVAGECVLEVLGSVHVPVEWESGAAGVVELQVVETMPRGFPNVIVGRDSMQQRGWTVKCGGWGMRVDEGTEVEWPAVDGARSGAAAPVIVVENGQAEVVYGGGLGEEVDDDEVDSMPPAELTQKETLEAVHARMEALGRDEKVMSEEGWRAVQGVFERRWQAAAHQIGGATGFMCGIDTGDARPRAHRMHRYTEEQHVEIDRQVAEMLERGVVRPSASEWATSMVLSPKKDGTWRAAVDYRQLNEVSRGDEYPLPLIEDVLNALKRGRIFTTLDLLSGFWQIPLCERDKEKTAFRTRRGLWEFQVLPFGVRTGTSVFQRVMNTVLGGMEGVLIYVDDVMIYTETEEEHVRVLDEVMRRLVDAKMTVKMKKCDVARSSVEFLGHMVGGGRVWAQERLLSAVAECGVPKDKGEVRQFVGLTGFYRALISNYSAVAAPLTDVMGPKATWVWGEEQQVALERLKVALGERPVLRLPDFSKPFTIMTDASDVGLGAALMQRADDAEEGQMHVVRYMSRKIKGAETRYTVTEKEMLAVVEALRKWRTYLGGRRVTVYTDHSALVWLVKRGGGECSARVQRWLMVLQAFDIELLHVQGKMNVVADALSREPFITVTEEAKEAARRADAARKAWQSVGVVGMWGGDGAEPAGEEVEVDDPADDTEADWSWVIRGHDGREEVERWWAELAEKQERDAELSRYRERVSRGERVAVDKGTLELDEGVLFKREKDGRTRVAVPVMMRDEMLRSMHEDVRTGGHFGARKAMKRARNHWWWPQMARDVEQWVSTCKVCQAYEMRKGVPRVAADLPRIVPNRPWASVYIDAVGPLPRGEGGYQYILVAIDHFTRYAEVKAVRRLTAETFVDWMRYDLINRWGPMARVTTDRGSNFMSDIAQAVYQAVGVERHRVTAWRPQANGLVERFNGTLKQLMKAYAEETGSKWPTAITSYAYAYNTAVHSATGYTPFYMMHGWEAKLPYELLLEQRGQSEYKSVNRYVEELLTAVNDCWVAAAEEMSEGDRRKHWSPSTTPKRKNPVPRFEPEQRVWVSKPFQSPGESKATKRLWYGPYMIVKRISDLVYVVAREGYEDEIHVDRIKRYRSEDQDGPRERYERYKAEEERLEGVRVWQQRQAEEEVEQAGERVVAEEGGGEDEDEAAPEGPGELRILDYSEPTVEELREEAELEALRAEEEMLNRFEVESILDKRTLRRSARLDQGERVEYLVKWKYWPDTDATWERAENVVATAGDAVRMFESASRAV